MDVSVLIKLTKKIIGTICFKKSYNSLLDNELRIFGIIFLSLYNLHFTLNSAAKFTSPKRTD